MKWMNRFGAGLARGFFEGIKKSPPLSVRHIKLLLKCFFLLLLALGFLYGFGAAKLDSLFDFASYLFPCFAAGIAGAGLIFRSSGEVKLSIETTTEKLGAVAEDSPIGRDGVFYAVSVVLLFVGVLCYTLAHRTCRAPAVSLCALFYLVPTGFILRQRIMDDRMALLRSYADAVVFQAIIYGAGLIAVALIFYGSDSWLAKAGTYLCAE